MSRLHLLPSWLWAVVLMVTGYYAIELLHALPSMHIAASDRPRLEADQFVLLSGFGLAYGLFRAAAYHPTVRPGYLPWLRTTPWRPGRPLPLGPVVLTWWDAIVIGVLVLLTLHQTKASIASPLVAFAFGYLIVAFVVLRTTLPWCAYTLALGTACCVRFFLSFTAVAAIAVGLFVFAHIAMIWSLRGYPWEKDPSCQPPERLGWLGMLPHDTGPLVSMPVAIAACVMVGCWAWAILSVVNLQSTFSGTDAVLLSIVIGGVGALLRCARYCASYRAPISPIGRLLSGRLVIPGYDYVFLAPAAAPILGGATALAAAITGATAPVIVSVGSSAGLAVLLIAPPTFRNWQLTGSNRRSRFRKDTLASAQQRDSNPSLARIWSE